MIETSHVEQRIISSKHHSAHPWLKDFVLTWLCRFGIFLAHHVTRPLLPLYLITFGASSTVIGAVMAVFTITATMMRIPIGLLIDRVGRKPFLLYGIAFFTAGKLGYLWAPSILLMLPFRVLHGLGWSGCTTAVSTINADIVPQARRGELMGYAGMASSLASALGPVLGFALFHRFDYSGVFHRRQRITESSASSSPFQSRSRNDRQPNPTKPSAGSTTSWSKNPSTRPSAWRFFPSVTAAF